MVLNLRDASHNLDCNRCTSWPPKIPLPWYTCSVEAVLNEVLAGLTALQDKAEAGQLPGALVLKVC